MSDDKSKPKPPSRGQRRQAKKAKAHAEQTKSWRRQKEQNLQHQEQIRIRQQQLDEQEQAKVAEMPIVHTKAAGIDVGDRSHWVCVDCEGDPELTTREFPAHTQGLRELAQWLRQWGVTSVAVEASGVYGHVLFLHLLEAGLVAVMIPPQFARQIKGRPKTDRLDCQWIQRLHKLGLLPSVFQPDEATQTLRDLVRQRANHVRLSAEHIQRMQKALTLMNLKLTSVLGDVTGVTGLNIIRAILAGERDPAKLAKLRDRRCKHSVADIELALDGRYRTEHLLELEMCFTMWGHYQDVVAKIDEAIAKQLGVMKRSKAMPPLEPKPRVRGRKPHDPKFDVRTAIYYVSGVDLTEIEGIDEIHALTLISELGCDFSKWPTVKHFTSWLGLCPNFKKTGGKVKSSQTRKGKNRAATAFRLAAWSLMRSRGYLGAYLRRQRARLGAPKAVTAAAHKLARIVYNLMRYGLVYVKKTEGEYAEQTRAKQEQNLHRRARELGYEVKKIESPPESPEAVAERPVVS